MENDFNITSAQYVSFASVNTGIIATVNGESISVSIDPANRHYAAIKAKHDDPNDSFTIQDAD